MLLVRYHASSRFRTSQQLMDQAQQTLAILFADIAGSTALYETVGDVEAHRRVAESLAFMAQAVSAHQGEVLRTVGDSTLASFVSCDNALLAACTMQELHKQTPLSVRAGFHYGPVIPDKGDVYGNAVNIAARVASFAKTEEITATEFSISQLSAENRDRATLLDKIHVKGIAEPMGVFRITWEADVDLHTRVAQPASSTMSMNLQTELVLRHGKSRFLVNKIDSVLSMGRDEQCSIEIDGDKVSRKHAHLQWSAGQIQLSDTSTNGTYIHREGQAPLFVRRETVVLEGRGEIGLGSLPGEDAALALHFDVTN